MKNKLLTGAIMFIVFSLCSGINYAASGDTIVHRTKSGEKYHTSGCRYLSRSDYEITLENAVNRGLTPCSVCNPPRLDQTSIVNEELENDDNKSVASFRKSDIPRKYNTTNNTINNTTNNVTNQIDEDSDTGAYIGIGALAFCLGGVVSKKLSKG